MSRSADVRDKVSKPGARLAPTTIHLRLCVVGIKVKVKINVWVLTIALLTYTRTSALYNLGSGS